MRSWFEFPHGCDFSRVLRIVVFNLWYSQIVELVSSFFKYGYQNSRKHPVDGGSVKPKRK